MRVLLCPCKAELSRYFGGSRNSTRLSTGKLRGFWQWPKTQDTSVLHRQNRCVRSLGQFGTAKLPCMKTGICSAGQNMNMYPFWRFAKMGTYFPAGLFGVVKLFLQIMVPCMTNWCGRYDHGFRQSRIAFRHALNPDCMRGYIPRVKFLTRTTNPVRSATGLVDLTKADYGET